MSWTRIRAIFRKEVREYQRNRSIVLTMAVIPLVFVAGPLINIFALPPDAAGQLRFEHILVYMLGIPAIVPAVIASYSVVGERIQGSLEPVLTTPIPREELLLAKALAALVPSLIISYVVFIGVVVAIELFAQPGIASSLILGPDVLAQVIFTPLVAGWSIWVGIAISTKVSEARTAQQLGTFASVPSAIIAALIAYGAIAATLQLAVGAAALLIVLNIAGWRVTSTLFDRERLIAGAR
jgi:ABC-type transport system involved in multi-copper enzyme maturation permease subunit